MEPWKPRQPLSSVFPSKMIEYITKNPPKKPETQWKLIKLSKVWFDNHPIIPVRDPVPLTEDSVPHILCFGFCNEETPVVLNISKIQVKLWLIESLEFSTNPKNLDGKVCPSYLSMLLSKVYRCDLKRINLPDITLSFNEWLMLSESGMIELLFLFKTTILHDNGNIVALEEILATLSGTLECLKFYPSETLPSAYTSETSQKLSQLPPFPKLKKFSLFSINAYFNPEHITGFIMNNTCQDYCFNFTLTYFQESFDEFLNAMKDIVKAEKEAGNRMYILCQRK